MTQQAQQSVLRRMAQAGRGLPSGGGAPTPARALGQAFARAAEKRLGLPLRVAAVRELRASLAEFPERIADHALLAVLQGPEEGLGLMALSPALFATIVEMLTTRRLAPGEVMPRRPTRTDAALAAPVIDQVLTDLEEQLAADPAVTWAGGFRYGSMLDDARPIPLIFEDCAYRAFEMEFVCGEEVTRSCTAFLALPAEGRGPRPLPAAPADGSAPRGAQDSEAEWQARMAAAVRGARAPLHAVLDRVSLPLDQVIALKPGALVPLSRNALSRVSVEGAGDRRLLRGRLGQSQGNLAVRLYLTPQPGEMADEAGPL
ncbi:FliM/FliN family flagellar motor switch protein, partial [Albidovulum sp.]